MRAFNERLVLSLVRRHGSLSKSEIARATGLSAQTISVIMRELENDKLLIRGKPVRGRVGQPSIPMSLNAEGSFFLGLKIGRRSCEILLTDFLGRIVLHTYQIHAFPMPDVVLEFAAHWIGEARNQLGDNSGRISGLGIAIPFELWNWADEAGATANAMAVWRDCDIRGKIAQLCDWPVYLQNDATAACGAELAFGKHVDLQDFIYFYIGTFAGGGVVLNGSLYPGRMGNAGAFGSMPVPGPDGKSMQLIDQTSLVILERELIAKGVDASPLWQIDNDWAGVEDEAESWIEQAAGGLAHAIVAAMSVIDFEAAVIDGGFPRHIRAKMLRKTAKAIEELDLQGLNAPQLLEGTLGSVARALGGASLPLFDRYLIDQNTLMREAA
ncbi:MAG: ROK family transcriptional regulator [Hyphomicrobiales bacterium]|nr:ROK family transcriptional regulator [Hyphomicrobiales bacterium]